MVRATGGLADSVEQANENAGTGTGVLFRDYNAEGLYWALNRALDLYQNRAFWAQLIQNGMQQNFSWDEQGARYVELFRKLSQPQ